MPTENELKFVMRMGAGCEEEIARFRDGYALNIKQAYIGYAKGMTIRVRSEEKEGITKYKLCFKQKVGDRVVEIEKKLDKRDFDDLWGVSLSRLEKTRYVLDFKGSIWEVDFFRLHADETYFILAEHEMPEGQKAPRSVPDLIKKYLVYSVPENESDIYSSKQLACVRHAKKLYRKFERQNEEVQKVS